jgi:hypothetical protein
LEKDLAPLLLIIMGRILIPGALPVKEHFW